MLKSVQVPSLCGIHCRLHKEKVLYVFNIITYEFYKVQAQKYLRKAVKPVHVCRLLNPALFTSNKYAIS